VMESINFFLTNASCVEYQDERLPLYEDEMNVSNTPPIEKKFFSSGRIYLTLFGKTDSHESVAIILNDFEFYFFAKIPSNTSTNAFVSNVRSFMPSGVRIEVVQRIPALGFCNGVQQSFVKFYMSSFSLGFIVRKLLLSKNFEICEADSFTSQHKTSFLVSQLFESISSPNLPASWFAWYKIDFKSNPTVVRGQRYTNCVRETIASCKHLQMLPDYDLFPRMNILSVDIECFSEVDHVFPTADTCPVNCIGVSLFVYDTANPQSSKITKRLAFSFLTNQDSPRVLKQLVGDEEFELHILPSEIEMFNAFRDFFFHCDVDIITGYNVWKFDFAYLFDRARVIDPTRKSRFYRLGKILHSWTGLGSPGSTTKSLSSSALGDNDFTMLNAPGITEVDVFAIVKNMKGFSSYKLKDVSKQILPNIDGKIDLPYAEINRLWRCFQQSGDVSLMSTIAGYCIRDADIPLLILDKIGFVSEQVAVSIATFTPITSLVSCGQTIKVRNMLFQQGHAMGFVFNQRNFSNDSDVFQGATVIKPIPGYYLEPVATLDFNSLYPSCIIMKNLCFSTLIVDDNYRTSGVPSRPTTVASLQDAVSDSVPEFSVTVDSVSGRTHRFAQHIPGIIPTMLSKLLEARSIVKRQISAAQRNNDGGCVEPWKMKQLNSRQLALKLCANSVFGFCNAKSNYRCLPVAESTTAIGRSAIDTAKRIAEAHPFNCKVVYGDTDSIMVKMPIDIGKPISLSGAIETARQIGVAVTSHFSGKMILEFENVKCPYLLTSKKKRYSGLVYTSHLSRPIVPDVKGFELVRKDSFPFCHKIQERLFSILMQPTLTDFESSEAENRIIKETRRQAAIEFITEMIQCLVRKTVKLDDLVTSKSLRREYKNIDSIIHAVVNKQIATVSPGREFSPGDRVPFLILTAKTVVVDPVFPSTVPTIDLRGHSSNLSERAVYVEFCKEFPLLNQNIDWQYYLGRIKPSLIQLMTIVSNSPKHVAQLNRLFDEATRSITRTTRTFSSQPHKDIGNYFNVKPTTHTPYALKSISILPPPPIRFLENNGPAIHQQQQIGIVENNGTAINQQAPVRFVENNRPAIHQQAPVRFVEPQLAQATVLVDNPQSALKQKRPRETDDCDNEGYPKRRFIEPASLLIPMTLTESDVNTEEIGMTRSPLFNTFSVLATGPGTIPSPSLIKPSIRQASGESIPAPLFKKQIPSTKRGKNPFSTTNDIRSFFKK
jgi:DNA polymerase elongation subunit (family B)